MRSVTHASDRAGIDFGGVLPNALALQLSFTQLNSTTDKLEKQNNHTPQVGEAFSTNTACINSQHSAKTLYALFRSVDIYVFICIETFVGRAVGPHADRWVDGGLIREIEMT